MRVLGLAWVGTRTEHFPETVAFFRETLGLSVGRVHGEFIRFDVPDGSSVEVFGTRESDHPYFTTGPVVGFRVEDLDSARHDLWRHRIELLGSVGGEMGSVRWQHFRGPDGYVYEIVEKPVPPKPRVGPLGVTGLVWMGTRTPRYEETRAFLGGVLGLPVAEDLPELTEYRLPDGASVEVFLAGSSLDHPHFTTGPVPGFGVEDVDRAVASLRSQKVPVLLSKRTEHGGWDHFRAPDGRVYEIKGPRPH